MLIGSLQKKKNFGISILFFPDLLNKRFMATLDYFLFGFDIVITFFDVVCMKFSRVVEVLVIPGPNRYHTLLVKEDHLISYISPGATYVYVTNSEELVVKCSIICLGARLMPHFKMPLYNSVKMNSSS